MISKIQRILDLRVHTFSVLAILHFLKLTTELEATSYINRLEVHRDRNLQAALT